MKCENRTFARLGLPVGVVRGRFHFQLAKDDKEYHGIDYFNKFEEHHRKACDDLVGEQATALLNKMSLIPQQLPGYPVGDEQDVSHGTVLCLQAHYCS